MEDSSQPESQGLKYALFGAIALIAILAGALAVVAFGGGDNGGTPANADADPESVVPSPTNDDQPDGENGASDPGATAETAPATQAAATGSGNGGNPTAQGQSSNDGSQPSATPTPPPTPTPTPDDGTAEPTTQSQQGATATSTQQATATPTRTPTKPAPTATKPAPTATKTATKTATATPTKTATPTPTASPTVIPSSNYSLFVEIDDSNSLSDSVARPAGPFSATIIVSVIFEGSAQKARVVVQGTCTGTGAQHVRFFRHGDGELFPCNRTLLDIEVPKSGNVPKTVAIFQVAALETGASNVQWTIAATTLAIP